VGEGATPEAEGDSLGPVAGEGTGAPGALFCGLGKLDDVRILGTSLRSAWRPVPKAPVDSKMARWRERLGCELSMSDLYLVVFEVSIFAAA